MLYLSGVVLSILMIAIVFLLDLKFNKNKDIVFNRAIIITSIVVSMFSWVAVVYLICMLCILLSNKILNYLEKPLKIKNAK